MAIKFLDDKCTANEFAKLALEHAAYVPVEVWSETFEDEWEVMTEKERDEVQRLVEKQYDRVRALLNIDAIHAKIRKTAA